MFDDLLAANAAYAASFTDSGMAGEAAKGLAILTCIDSRIDPLAIAGLEPGDAKIIRNAGARVSEDALRSIILAVNLLKVERLCIVHHTECAMVGRGEEEVRAKVSAATGHEVGTWDFLASTDSAATMAADVATLRACTLLPDSLEIGTFIFDVHTGELHPVIA